jgi:hypothetical protein
VEQKDQKIGKYEDGSEQVIGARIHVRRALGPGLLESAYEACLCHELLAVRIGLLVNFNVISLGQGLRRLSLAAPSSFSDLSDLSDLFVALPLPSGRGLLRAAPLPSVESRD